MIINNSLKLILFFISVLYIVFSQAELQKNLNEQSLIKNDRRLLRAKELEQSGNYAEAEVLYKELNNDYPGITAFYNPLKKILYKKEAWNDLINLTIKYNDEKNSFDSKISLIEAYIWAGQIKKFELIANKLIDTIINNNKTPEKYKKNQLRTLIYKIIHNNQFDFINEQIESIRLRINIPDFFCFELASYHKSRMAFEKSNDEYLLYLKFNPKDWELVSEKILSTPLNKEETENLKAFIKESDIKEASLILSDLEFQKNNFNEAFNIIKSEFSNNFEIYLNFIRDLKSVNQFNHAKEILNDIISESNDTNIVNNAILELAYIFEIESKNNEIKLPIASSFVKNLFLNSAFISTDPASLSLIERAISIYDSLSISDFDEQAAFRLAEIKFQFFGDLDNAFKIYSEIQANTKNTDLYINCIYRQIDVLIAKGDLDAAIELVKKEENSIPIKNIKKQLKLKNLEILFLNGNLEKIKTDINTNLLDIEKTNNYYNDMMDILALLIPFESNSEDYQSFIKIQKHIKQNQRIQAIEELTRLLETTKNDIIIDLARYQLAYLNFLQKEYEITFEYLKKINHNTIYQERAQILISEIYDYVLSDTERAIGEYIKFLDTYPLSIYYEQVRMRLRKIAS